MSFWRERERLRLRKVKYETEDSAGFIISHTTPSYTAKMLIQAIDKAQLECECNGDDPEQYDTARKAAVALTNKLRSIEGLPELGQKVEELEDYTTVEYTGELNTGREYSDGFEKEGA